MPRPHPTLTRTGLLDRLSAREFRLSAADTVGAEAELIPWSLAPADLLADQCRKTAEQSRSLWNSLARRAGLNTETPPKEIPWSGGRLTLEPGGQLEFSGAPHPSVATTMAELREVAGDLRLAAIEDGNELLAVGLHPWAGAEDVELINTSPRYLAMQSYFDTISPHGRRMMRTTSSVQVCVDHGADPQVAAERWELAQRLSPLLLALFANSSVSAGRAAHRASERAWIWRHLDPARTGFPSRFLDDPQSSPIEQYLDFALAAPVMFWVDDQGQYLTPEHRVPFSDWMEQGLPTIGYPDVLDWDHHLSTMFPNVRPRGYLEVRSIDNPGWTWLDWPILIVGLALLEPRCRLELLEYLRPLHDGLTDWMIRAEGQGLADSQLRDQANFLIETLRGHVPEPSRERFDHFQERVSSHHAPIGPFTGGSSPLHSPSRDHSELSSGPFPPARKDELEFQDES